MTKHEKAEEIIVSLLKGRQWASFGAIRSNFRNRANFMSKPTISDTTLRRVLMKLRKEGLVECKWKCVYPRFFLAYAWVGEL